MELTDEHRRNISQGLRDRWQRKRQVDEAKDKVVELARAVSHYNGEKRFRELREALKELDGELART